MPKQTDIIGLCAQRKIDKRINLPTVCMNCMIMPTPFFNIKKNLYLCFIEAAFGSYGIFDYVDRASGRRLHIFFGLRSRHGCMDLICDSEKVNSLNV